MSPTQTAAAFSVFVGAFFRTERLDLCLWKASVCLTPIVLLQNFGTKESKKSSSSSAVLVVERAKNMKGVVIAATASALAVGSALASPHSAHAHAAGKSAGSNPTFAFTYTAQGQNWMSDVESGDLEAVFVYAGDVEFYCRGSPTSAEGGGASPSDLACTFTGPSPNAFVYYSDVAKNASAVYKAAGKKVFINFDGRITPKVMSFVPDFSLLSATAISEFANATAAHVCDDPNVDGMAWDVEPFSNNQVTFFSELDKRITACGKRWGVFAFGESLGEEMWTTGLGDSGFLFDSTCVVIPPPLFFFFSLRFVRFFLRDGHVHHRWVSGSFSRLHTCTSLCRYDLDCTAEQLPPHGCQPCQCTPPAVYETVLTEHLSSVMALAKQCVLLVCDLFILAVKCPRRLQTTVALPRYSKPYMLMVSGSGSTQLYEECTTSTCSGAGGGPVYNATCPYTMADWMAKAVKVFDVAGSCGDLPLHPLVVVRGHRGRHCDDLGHVRTQCVSRCEE